MSKDCYQDKGENYRSFDRRSFIKSAGLGVGAGLLAMQQSCKSAKSVVAPPVAEEPPTPAIAGFEDTGNAPAAAKVWTPVSERKIRMGLVGYGVCKFSTHFGFQTHPNVEVVAVSDLIPERCAALAKHVRCDKTYPSLEEMLKDRNNNKIEAIFLGTDAPSHGRQCIDVLKHGIHVGVAVPAIWGTDQLEDAEKLLETVKRTGLNYMMFETSAYRDHCYAMRQIYRAGGFGKMIYSEGEYFHYAQKPIDSFNGWRDGVPPQYYPTHSNGFYNCVTDGSFTEVSCMGHRGSLPHFQPENNRYKNPFSSEIALFRTSEGGSARMAVAWDTPGLSDETGRNSGERGAWWSDSFRSHYYPHAEEFVKTLDLQKPPLPPTVAPGSHGGSHGNLGHEFVMSILENRKPLVDIAMSLNMTVAGIIAHRSALKNGELLKIPQFKMWK